MMQFLPPAITELIEALRGLPGVGQKTAERYTFFLLRQNPLAGRKIADSLQAVGQGFSLCAKCQNYTETEICPLCADPSRDSQMLCVVAEPLDIVSFENAAGYRGLYHVLHGLIAPMEGVGPEDLKIQELLQRVPAEGITEVILALDTDLSGEATAVYISRALKELSIKVTRLAQGLPQGGEIGYTDPDTLSRALNERREF